MVKAKDWRPGEFEAMCKARTAKAAATVLAKSEHSVPRSSVYPFRNGWRAMLNRKHIGVYNTEEEAVTAFREAQQAVK